MRSTWLILHQPRLVQLVTIQPDTRGPSEPCWSRVCPVLQIFSQSLVNVTGARKAPHHKYYWLGKRYNPTKRLSFEDLYMPKYMYTYIWKQVVPQSVTYYQGKKFMVLGIKKRKLSSFLPEKVMSSEPKLGLLHVARSRGDEWWPLLFFWGRGSEADEDDVSSNLILGPHFWMYLTHCQHHCVTCREPRWPLMVAPGQSEPHKLIWGISQGQNLAWADIPVAPSALHLPFEFT